MKTGPVALRLARRELRGGLKGFRVFLACLALGVGAIAAVGSITSAILNGLLQDGQAILGGDIALRTTHKDITKDQRAWLEREANTSRVVVMRAMARAASGGDRSLIDLKAIDGRYPLYGTLVTDPPIATETSLNRRNGAWGAIVDPALLDRLGLRLGDTVRVGDATFQIRARLLREPDRTGGVRPLTLGPRFLVSDNSLDATGLIRPGSQIRYLTRVRLDPGIDYAGWKRDMTDAFPDAVWSVRDRDNASPTVKRFVDRTGLFMTLVGLTALLVGGVGVGNAVRTYLGGKTATIATLKCLGATTGVIFRVYMAQILAMSVIGIAIGLAIGVTAPFLLAALYPENDLFTRGVGIQALPLVLAAVFGVLVTLLFSLWPLARACVIRAAALFRDTVARDRRLPDTRYIVASAVVALTLAGLAVGSAVDKRIALWFVGGAIMAMIIFRLAGALVVAAAKRLHVTGRTTVRLGLANLHRPGAATASVVMSLGLGLTVLVTIALIEGNMRHQIRENLPANAPAYFFVDIQPDQVAGFESTIRGLDSNAEVERTPMLRGRITAVNGVPADQVKVASNVRWVMRGDRGLTWADAMPDSVKVVAGEWWPTDYKGPPLVSLAADAAEGLGIGIGDTLTVNILGRSMTARIASLREIRWASMRMNFVLMFSPGVIESAPQTHLATLRANNGLDRQIERAVTDRFPNITAIRIKDVLGTVNEFLERLGVAVRLTAGVTIIAGILVLAGAVVAGHRRRVYDSVVMKVLGATRRDMVNAYLVEFGVLGLATACVASLLGGIAAWAVITQVMRVEWVFLPEVLALTATIATVVTLGFGLIGTWRAMGQKAAPHLRNE